MFWKPSMCWAQCWAFWRLRCHLRAFRHKDLNMYSPKIFGYNREIFLLSIKHSAPDCYSSKFCWITEWMEPLVWKLTRELGSNRILEGVYTFLAYLAYVKEEKIYWKMSAELKKFMLKNNISIIKILKYRRFNENYLLSLPWKKKVYYLLYFLGQERFLRKIL